jgi:putative flippase GtrA
VDRSPMSMKLDGLALRRWAILLSRYSSVGLLATGVYFTVANVLILSDIVPAITASVIAYATGMVVSFIGQSRFTFRVSSHSKSQVVRYLVLSVIGFGVSYASVYLATVYFGVCPIWGTAATAISVPALSFVVMKVWVFKT